MFKSLRFVAACVGAVSFATVTTAELVTIDASTVMGDLLLDGTAYPDGLTIQNIAAKTVTLQHITVGCPGLRIRDGQDAGGRLTLNNVTAACSAVPAGEGVILMSGGQMRGAVTVENCTVSGDRAQTDSTLLQIRKPAGRLAIRGGRLSLSSDFMTHRCIDLRNVQSTAVVTVDDVYARASVFGSNGGSGLRIDRAVAGAQITVTGGYFEGRVNRIDGFGVELFSVPAGVTVSLNNIEAIGDGRSDCAALKVLNSACTVAVNGGKYRGEASTVTAKALDFDAFSGSLVVMHAELVAEGGHNGAATVWIRTSTGRFAFAHSSIRATAATAGARGFNVFRLNGAAAALAIDNCTVTATSPQSGNAVQLEQTSDNAAITVTRSTLSALAKTTGFVFADYVGLTALRVTTLTGGATVNVSDTALVSRGDGTSVGAALSGAAAGTAITLLRATVSAVSVKSVNARGMSVTSNAAALTVDGCTVTASSVKGEVVGVFLYRSVGGSVAFTGTTFNVIAAEDSPVVRGTILYNGGIVALDDAGTTAASALTMSVTHCSFNGDGSAARLVLVRYPRQWSGVSKLTIVDVAATAHFNSFRGLISVATTYRRPSLAVGASITRCFTGISRSGLAVADNTALPNTASAVDCAGAPTPVPATPVPETPAPDTPVPETPAPATPAPITPAPQTPAPETPVPETPAPETPSPATPAPATPVPDTPSPVTPTPATPVPGTPNPVTPSPDASQATPAPVTPEPGTPEPQTPSPTAASLTAAPATPAPATLSPATPSPQTPAPATPTPQTPAPGGAQPAPVPATSVPATPAPVSPRSPAPTPSPRSAAASASSAPVTAASSGIASSMAASGTVSETSAPSGNSGRNTGAAVVTPTPTAFSGARAMSTLAVAAVFVVFAAL